MLHIKLKKITALMLTVLMLFTVMPVTYSAEVSDFVDFPTGWSADAVKAAVDNGLLVGRTATELVPGGCLTRAEMATIVNRAFGAKIEADISSYKDVSRSAWYYHEIAKAVNMQTFQGDGTTIMRPDDCITREEVFTVIARAFVLESNDYSPLDKFYDAAQISDWAKPYLSILTAKGYVNGDNLGNVNPKKNISREEFAQVMHNIVKTYYTHSGDFTITGPDSSLIRTTGVTLRNITIDGDLVLGDGVGFGTVVLENVTIKGRLLARGGENSVKLINTTVGEMVVVKDVNGIVHFHNYRSEAPFAGIVEITRATFLEEQGTIIHGGGSSGGSSSVKGTYYDVTFMADGEVVDVIEIKEGNSIGSSLPEAPKKDGKKFVGWFTGLGTADEKEFTSSTPVSSDMTIEAKYVEAFKVTFYEGVVAKPEKEIDVIEEVPTGSSLSEVELEGEEDIDDWIKNNVFDKVNSIEAEFEDYKHEVKRQLLYKDDAGDLVPFDKSVKITADTDVFCAFKYVSANAKIKYGKEQTVTFAAPYEADTRVADTLKDLLILGRNQVRAAFKTEDIYGQLIEKAASKSGGFLDNEGNIRKVEATSWIIDIIKSDEIEGEIEYYAEDMIINGTYEYLKPLFEQTKDSAYITSICGGTYGFDKVAAHLDTIKGDADKVKDFVGHLYYLLKDSEPYQTFLKSFVNKESEVVVNSDNVFYMRAVAYAVGERYDYDTLKEKIKNKFGAIIDIIGDDIAREFLEEAQVRYENGAMALCDDIDADASHTGSYDAFLTFLLNPIEHVARPIYGRAYEKAMNKITADNKYYYNENAYLQQLVGRTFDDVRDMLFVPGTVVDETYTGYMLNPNTYNSDGTVNEPGVMKYYDTLIREVILADKAALWYKDNLTAEQLEALKDDILADVAQAINETNAAVKAFDEDGIIPVIGMKLDKLMSYNAFSKVYAQIEGIVNKVIGKYKSTEFYGEIWTAASLEAKFPDIREKIDVALGLDKPVFTADNVVEDDTIWNKLGFNKYAYPSDDSEGAITLNAFKRLFNNNFVGEIAARRYYQ